jgi:hypothetical protein
MGSLRPPRHCRMKAKQARVNERTVRSKRRREAKDCEEDNENVEEEEEEEDDEGGLKTEC